MELADKIKGMFFGVAIGDALGMPVETWSQKRIAEKYPDGIREYLSPDGHKWFDGMSPGTWTDDTQLSIAVAKGLVVAGKFDMNNIATEHVEVFREQEKVRGWGASSREAVQRLRDGIHWSKSASQGHAGKLRGGGNGVAMKIAPLAAYHFIKNTPWKQVVAECAVFAKMTHATNIGIAQALAQDHAVQFCLGATPDTFDRNDFIEQLIERTKVAEVINPPRHGQDNLSERFGELTSYNKYRPNDIVRAFRGSSYAFDSLPFAYMFFVKNPTFHSIYDIVYNGGDTDTNASISGALVGALHGVSIFPPNLVDKLYENEVICSVAEGFCEAFVPDYQTGG